MDKRALIVAGAILLIPAILLAIWALQGESMESDFAEALRNGDVAGLHRDLQGKQWTADELATIDVLKIPGGYGRERAIARSIQTRNIFVSRQLFEYQATIRDDTTGLVHVFGFRRSEPRQWCWDQFHPNSLQAQVKRRLKQVEEMKNRAAGKPSL